MKDKARERLGNQRRLVCQKGSFATRPCLEKCFERPLPLSRRLKRPPRRYQALTAATLCAGVGEPPDGMDHPRDDWSLKSAQRDRVVRPDDIAARRRN